MIIDGLFPETLEARVLMAKHLAGAQLDVATRGCNNWQSRHVESVGKPFSAGNSYRLTKEVEHDS